MSIPELKLSRARSRSLAGWQRERYSPVEPEESRQLQATPIESKLSVPARRQRHLGGGAPPGSDIIH